jgi:hypothetical protein
MEGDAYFVALILRDDEHDGDLTIFPSGVVVEEAGDDATRQSLIDFFINEEDQYWGRSFTLLSALVARDMPFDEPTECEVELTFEGKVGASDTIRESKELTRIADTFIIDSDFTLEDAFAELNRRAKRQNLSAPLIYNFSPVKL